MVTPPLTRAPRRWPPLASGVIAAVLVLIVLPNPLKVPQQNPTATAEYAPVPGNSDEDAQNANFGETGLANSGGIGSGGSGSGFLSGTNPPPPPPPQFKPQQKACYGNPPKQTQDPLSPPCVPYFDGDNGGSTWRGVSKNEIKVVFYNDLGVEGDMNSPWDPSQENTGAQTAPYQYINLVRTIKAQLRYFQAKYQTYGRFVRVVAQKSSGGIGSTCPARQGDAAVARKDLDPFATVHLGDNGQCYMSELAKKWNVPTFGLNSDVTRANYENYRPYIWGFFPDQEAEARWSASFICESLYQDGKGVAKFANDPSLAARKRKFGFIVPTKSNRGPESEQLAALLEAYTKEICGLDLKENKQTFNAASDTAPSGAREAPSIMSRYKTENVTTIICYCTAVQPELTVTQMQNQAKTLEYLPEWYWDHASRMFRTVWLRTYSDAAFKHFGVNHHWRQPEYKRQWHYQAYAQMEPGSEPNAFFNFDIYHLFLNLFEAIQAAGPKLTPESVQQGMYTFHYTSQKDPFVPTGGYGPYNSKAVADLTFVDTAMAWWWDPQGRARGETGDGCVRLMDNGRRYYWDEWPKNDDLLFTDGPCSPDDRKFVEGGEAGA